MLNKGCNSMSVTTRQSNLFAAEDWRKIYTTFRSADFQSYDFETLRKSMVDYLRAYYPEDFNDFVESSEFIALIDLIGFMGQGLAFRSDLNARENFLETAERRDSVYRLAKLLGYSPNRNKVASGLLKIVSVSTTEVIRDSSGRNLANTSILWDDPTNLDWFEQFTSIVNAAMQPGQRVGKPAGSTTIGNIAHDLYQFRLRNNIVPVFPFSANVDGTSQPFEIYNATLDNDLGLVEASPKPGDSLGFVYRNDGRGNGSVNTGFFLAFKQGSLTNLDFTVGETLANRIVALNLNNINNSDVWLFKTNDVGVYETEWTKVDLMRGSNVIYNDVSQTNRQVYSVTSRANDQIDLVFADGVFADIPTGTFRAVVRTGNGLTYSINPQEMRSIALSIPYISRNGKIEAISIKASLQYTVSNATARESISDVKKNAPQFNYTQNRMVNGEDYNTLPFTKFTDIAKVKSVNRTASGLSRYLDITDPTAKYSSTNFFGDDGFIFKENDTAISSFTWNNISDIQRFIRGSLAESIKSKESKHLFYDAFKSYEISDLSWYRATSEADASTGYFAYRNVNTETGKVTYTPVSVGPTVSDNKKFLRINCLAKFEAPTGSFFDIDRSLKTGSPSAVGQTSTIWSTVVVLVDDGTAIGKGILSNGLGAVTLSENIPTGAIITEVYAPYVVDISPSVEQSILTLVQNNSDFGIRYDVTTQSWAIITGSNLIGIGTNIDVGNAGSSNDNSWTIAMINNGNSYTVYTRQLNYYFGSQIGTRFYIDETLRIFDSRTGQVVKDNVKLLKSNTQPDSSNTLNEDIIWEIYAPVRFADGYKDDTLVKITLADSDNDGVPDNPTLFDTLVSPETNQFSKLVFFQKYLDFDNLERYAWISPNLVSTSYPTENEIVQTGLNANPTGTIFYATTEDAFYVSTLVNGVKTAVFSENYKKAVGRSTLYFQYKHNAPADRRIDPSPTNIIDMYVLTTAYDTAYRQWLSDMSGTIPKPTAPSVVDLSIEYSTLENFKSVSDAIIFNPSSFRPLFGAKADPELQATFKVVKTQNSRISNNELRSNVVKVINKYFELDNWDFGDTFYYSELAAFIHKELTPDIATIVIVPTTDTQTFGSLFQITSQANEIFVSAATVDNVELIDSITASRLKSNDTGVIFTGTLASAGST